MTAEHELDHQPPYKAAQAQETTAGGVTELRAGSMARHGTAQRTPLLPACGPTTQSQAGKTSSKPRLERDAHNRLRGLAWG